MDTLSRKTDRTGCSVINRTLFFFGLLTLLIPAQEVKDYSSYQNNFAFDPVIMVDRNGVLSRGLFLDLEGDSLKLLLNSKIQKVAISSIKLLKIDSKQTNRDNMLSLGIAGAFACQLLLKKPDWQSDRFIQSDGLWAHMLVGALGAVAGGLVGIGIDMANSDKELEYDLENPKDVQKMRHDILRASEETSLNFHYEIAKVYARSDPAQRQGTGNYYSYDDITLNVFRSVRLTYDINEKIDAGVAIYSAAEPNLKYSYGSQNTYGNEEMSNRVYGYYATAFYNPFPDEPKKRIKVKAGAGAGFAAIDYTIARSKSVYDPVKYTTTVTSESASLNKTVFSGFLAVDLRAYPSSKVSIALTGDYIWIPEKTIPSNLPGESGKSFSNFSLGLSLGLHF